MDKLVLIDGNSLLNRAFYAMNVFTTKDGLPTNGIFGFVKLLLKIAEDEKPQYMAVAFDVHAPTFRHLKYKDYKGTRKPMPEELRVQVPVLKELLQAMNICTVELAGFEADDLIGTLSRKFGNVHVLIFTGDRDSYQLVKENVDVCFTKRGVSDLDRLTAENFFDKVGLEPAQIIEEKALMGDVSDNIPGVRGVGPKSALSLLQNYHDLDGVYANLDKIKGALHIKLEEGRENAYFSRELATIDTAVPLPVTLEECRLHLPFPGEARAFFTKLEFRSLINSQFFVSERANSEVDTAVRAESISDLAALYPLLEGAEEAALCVEKNAVYLCMGGKNYQIALRENFLSPGFFFPELAPLLSALLTEKRRVIVPDAKALAHTLDTIGLHISCSSLEDVNLLRYLLNSNAKPASAAELASEYSLPDSCCAQAVLCAYKEAIEAIGGTEEEKLYREIELPLEDVLCDMERTGVRIDLDKFPVFSEKFQTELSELSKRIYELADVPPFNLNSTFKLSEVLFGKLGLSAKGAKKMQRGGYSTSADVLEKLAESSEVVRLVLRYREIQKLQSTYIDGIRPLIVGGIVHTTYNQTVTTTGRLSSANPNLQNIPVRTDEGKELRKLFIAREGNILIDADYSQIELRLLAHFSKCAALVDSYRKGEDVHAATAARVFGVAPDEVTPSMRRRAKVVNFGIIYGMSAFGLAKDLGCGASEAADFIAKYFELHPEVKEYMDGNVQKAKEEGFVTTILGRKRFIPELKSSSYNTRAFGERAAMNMPLQGSAADIIKIAMLRVFDRLQREGLKTRLVLQVHDELLLDAPEEEAETAARLLKEEMEGAVALDVPLIAEVSMGRSWYDAK